MARRSKIDAERTRKRILASALSLFVRRGYEHTTFNDIAARLDLTKGAVYWHFESKEALLVALVEEMLEKFHRRLTEAMPTGELTFPAVAGMMVQTAGRIVEEPKSAAFFMLMKTQIRWGADSMAATREQLRTRELNSPYRVLVRALEKDRAAGRARADIDPVAVASVAISMWEGLIQAKIERLLQCELAPTLTAAYAAMWDSVRTDNGFRHGKPSRGTKNGK